MHLLAQCTTLRLDLRKQEALHPQKLRDQDLLRIFQPVDTIDIFTDDQPISYQPPGPDLLDTMIQKSRLDDTKKAYAQGSHPQHSSGIVSGKQSPQPQQQQQQQQQQHSKPILRSGGSTMETSHLEEPDSPELSE